MCVCVHLYIYEFRFAKKIMTVGDSVVIRPAETERLPYIARIEKIKLGFPSVADNVMVMLRWY